MATENKNPEKLGAGLMAGGIHIPYNPVVFWVGLVMLGIGFAVKKNA